MPDAEEDSAAAIAFYRSIPELSALLDRKRKEKWEAGKMEAEIRKSKWYLKTQESKRAWDLYAATEKPSAAAKVNAKAAELQDILVSLGGTMSYANLGNIAEQSLQFDWNEAQVRNMLGKYVTMRNGLFRGNAATDAATIQQAAWRNGTKMTSSTLEHHVQAIARGDSTLETVKAQLRQQAASLAPAFAEQLAGGADLYDATAAYRSMVANELELNEADVSLMDPLMKKGYSSTDKDGKPATLSMSAFQNEVRSDARWGKTKAAQSEGSQVANSLLKAWGLKGGF